MGIQCSYPTTHVRRQSRTVIIPFQTAPLEILTRLYDLHCQVSEWKLICHSPLEQKCSEILLTSIPVLS